MGRNQRISGDLLHMLAKLSLQYMISPPLLMEFSPVITIREKYIEKKIMVIQVCIM